MSKLSTVEIVYEKRAAKALRKMRTKQATLLMLALRAIAVDPFASNPNIKRLKGAKDAFRYRVADFRAIYRIDREAQVMRVELVKPRGEAYKP